MPDTTAPNTLWSLTLPGTITAPFALPFWADTCQHLLTNPQTSSKVITTTRSDTIALHWIHGYGKQCLLMCLRASSTNSALSHCSHSDGEFLATKHQVLVCIWHFFSPSTLLDKHSHCNDVSWTNVLIINNAEWGPQHFLTTTTDLIQAFSLTVTMLWTTALPMSVKQQVCRTELGCL